MVAKRGYGAVKKMNLGGRTGDMMYSRGYGADERSRRVPTELMTAPGMKKGGKVGMKTGGVIKRQRGGPGRRNLLEEMGRLDAERMNPNRRAERSRVIGELNRGFKKGGAAKMHLGGSTPKKGTGAGGPGGRYSKPSGPKKGTGAGGPGGRYSKLDKPSSSKAGMQSKQTKPSASKAGMQSKQSKRSSKDEAIMKAEKARRAKIKPPITGRSSAASGAYKKHEAAARKKHVLGTLQTGPSGRK